MNTYRDKNHKIKIIIIRGNKSSLYCYHAKLKTNKC